MCIRDRGRSTEITRDELKFTKFVQRLRKKFTELFNDLLRTQLVLKAIINEDDWVNVKEKIKYDFLADGHFSELKNAELLKEKGFIDHIVSRSDMKEKLSNLIELLTK